MEHDDKLYEEFGHTWRHFASWREKIFAGYLTVLAALGLAFSQNTSIRVRAAILAAAVLVSFVFWILDFRNSQILNACQAAAARLDGPHGAYSALCQLRKAGRKTSPTYGLAIDLLVGGVTAAAGSGLLVYVTRESKDRVDLVPLALAGAGALLLACALQWPRYRQWRQWSKQLPPDA